MTADKKSEKRPPEQPAVRTTIVGGRPPGSGKSLGDIPRGIEVLVKKAAVDPEFKKLLLDRRAEAAKVIKLELDPAEVMMLNGVPAAQLEAIIAHTTVSPMTRAAFLGRAAAVMLPALGAGLPPAPAQGGTRGIAPDRPSEAPPKGANYVVYQQTDYKGNVSCGVVEARAFRARLAQIARMNRIMQRAYALARKAWREDPERNNVQFPMPPPRPVRCRRLASYAIRAEAERSMHRRQEKLDERAEQQRKLEEQRLAQMGEEPREREKRRVELLRAAQQLFEAKLRALLVGGAPNPPRPGAIRGTRPERP